MEQPKNNLKIIADKKNARVILPNMLTLIGVCIGLSSIRFALDGKFEFAIIAIILAAIIDGLDGRIARLIKGTSKVGKELDSLTDMISFGVAPAFIMYFWSLSALGRFGWLLCLIYVICVALRLARFNVNSSQDPSWKDNFFQGVPSPAGGIIVLMPLIFSFSGLGVGPVHKLQGETATATFTKTDGMIDQVEVNEPGFGYTSAPSITINGSGSSLSNPAIVLNLDAQGRVDEDNITINDRGSGFDTIFLTPSANPNVGKIAAINIVEGEPKNYRVAPTLIIDAPTAADAEGNLLGTNVQAVVSLPLDGNGNLTGSATISQAGQGYIEDPQIRISSAVHNEIRAKDVQDILILYLNHKSDRSETLDETNPFELKAPFDTTARLYDQNGKLEHFGSTQIQNMGSTSINRYNVNSFVHID